MDKNTILAIVLSVIVISVGLTIQSTFFAPDPVEAPQTVVTTDIGSQSPATVQQPTTDVPISYAASAQAWDSGLPGSFVQTGTASTQEKFSYETDVFIVEFNPVGAAVSSLRLKDHLDNGQPVETIFNNGDYPAAFSLYAGDDATNPIDATFNYRIVQDTVEFSQTFAIVGTDGTPTDETFTLTKSYRFGKSDYLFEIAVEFKNSQNKAIPLNYNGFAYTLAFEPQLGPEFHETPDGNYTYRKFYVEQDGKKSTPKLRDGVYETNDFITWTAIASKYFSVIGIPDATRYSVTLTESKSDDIPLESRMYFSRPAYKTATGKDIFRFYVGPQLKHHMAIYNEADQNAFGLSDLHLEKALDSSSWLGWLEAALKWLLQFFYSLVPNYGIAIILLTILIKVVLQPFSKKSMESTSKMQALGPQMEELKAKYKDNPTKLNQEMGELYKKEKINPLGGCLPMLFQFPIFIALYGLLNKHFELRGAMFIPGWIEDLSLPESILHFSSFSLPLIGSDIRLLPILYGASMIFSFKISQAGTQQSGMTGKFMMYGMPVMFFFILYNAPSGLLLYWMVMNVISIGQQVYMNKKRRKKQALQVAAQPVFQQQRKPKKK
ncbi:MAG: membrane protein insertase YidC [Spirochaetae bacterium HGW-Spirochaetae-4]|jgi:YidC/Oxa1 family membrane protein insertase|nr:MAG: membrane protein insertase YidC [Spirochaetes bacterium GWC2_52_13]PKL22524.1 MAG: membrane protein insertase YidC [Spirochaetae bacterium HGW-Spirochaetae-4]HCG64324.1 membrane protein insertase YidC [Sphaerochaeta sp.]HCS35944.1 membrane protein insertase YidC [Sphaerochaeta sp.]